MNQQTKNEVQQVPVIQSQKRSGSFLKSILIFFSGITFCGLLVLIPLLFMSGDSTSDTISGPGDLSYEFVKGDKESENNIVVLYLDQPILTAAQSYETDLLTALLVGQYTFGYNVKEQIMTIAEDANTKGIILLINSPGGTIGGARAISDGVAYYQEETGKPVYAYIQDLGASGAYWAAVSADKIYAEQGSLVGSIGVIMGPFEYYDKLIQLNGVGTRNGITITYITAGESKDLGNPTRKITEDELNVLQEGINSEYDVFVDYVAKQRNISGETIREDIGALVYGAKEAKELGMIDEIGTWDDSILAIAEESGIVDNYRIVKLGFSTSLFGSISAQFKAPVQETSTEAPARICQLCNKMLYFHGNPSDY